MIGNFSISLLMQSFNESDHSPRNSFEQKIVLYKFDEDTSNEQLKTTILSNNTEDAYTVEGNVKVYWKPIKILDVFEIDSSISFENNCEVYSRFFIEENIKVNEILDKYFSDYIWEDKEVDKK